MSIFDFDKDLHLSACRRQTFAFFTLFCIILLIYSNSFDASWHLDDVANIVENRSIHLKHFTWEDLRGALSSPKLISDLVTVRPVSLLSLALNYYLGGLDVRGYHLVNILVHWIASLFLFLFIHMVLNLPRLKAKYGPQSYFLALTATVLWCANPIQTQAVTYVVQRMTSMAAMFYIMAMYLFIKGKVAPQGLLRVLCFLLCALCGLLAFGCKENAIMLPASLLLCDMLLLSDLSGKSMWKYLKGFICFCVLPLVAGILIFHLAGGNLFSWFDFYDSRPFTLWQRLLTEPRILLLYLSLALYPLPTRLSVDHLVELSLSPFNPPATLLSILLIIFMISWAVFLRKGHPLITFSILFFFLNHLVESTLLPLELIFEHRNYLPTMFLFLPIAAGLGKALSHFSTRRTMQYLIAAFITLFIIGEGHGTFERNHVWKDDEGLWLDCLEKYPASFRAHHNLGYYYHRNRDIDRALRHYLTALASEGPHRKDEKAITFFNLGIIAQDRGKKDLALENYRKAMALDPCLPGLHNNLASLLGTDPGQRVHAFDELQKAVDCGHEAEVPKALSNLGILLAGMGRIEEAVPKLEEALKRDPQNIITLKRLGYVYRRLHQLGRAYLCFRKALDLAPKDLQASMFLAEIHLLSGNPERAIRQIALSVEDLGAEKFVTGLRNMDGDRSPFSIHPGLERLSPVLEEVLGKEAGPLFH